MVIVSPFAKPAHTDHHPASFASILAFTEHVFDLAPLNSNDAKAYDYSGSFNFRQAPAPPPALTQTPVPAWEKR